MGAFCAKPEIDTIYETDTGDAWINRLMVACKRGREDLIQAEAAPYRSNFQDNIMLLGQERFAIQADSSTYSCDPPLEC